MLNLCVYAMTRLTVTDFATTQATRRQVLSVDDDDDDDGYGIAVVTESSA